MTERKRPDITFESWVERQIRVAQERGDLDDLPGSGKPIPHHGADELWWVKSYLAREGLSAETLLPPELQLRREIERLPDSLGTVPSEQAVREIVADLNRRVAECVRYPSGIPVPLHKVDAGTVIETWKAAREQRREDARRALRASQETPEDLPPARPSPRRSLFRWFRGR